MLAMRRTLDRSRGGFRGGVWFSATPPLPTADTSFSTDGARHGSKRAALWNLLSGLDSVFSNPTSPDAVEPTFCVVVEDDAVLSPDALAFFAFARDTIVQRKRNHHMEFATALSELRPSLLVGMRDAQLVGWLRGSAADAAAQVDALAASSRTVFTTRAWALTRRAYRKKLRPLLVRMAEHESPLTSPGAKGEGSVRSHTASTAPGGNATVLQRVSSPPTWWRSTHPELARCLWCSDYCYDHAIEWVLQGHRFLSPVVPRVSQGGEAGMSSDAPATNAVYEGPAIAPDAFRVVNLASVVLRMFPGLGMSAIAPRRTHAAVSDTSTWGRWAGPLGDGDALGVLAQEPTLHLASVVLLLACMTLSAAVARGFPDRVPAW